MKVKSDETHTTDVMKYDGGKRSKKFRLAAFSLSLTLMTLAAAARMGRFQSMKRESTASPTHDLLNLHGGRTLARANRANSAR